MFVNEYQSCEVLFSMNVVRVGFCEFLYELVVCSEETPGLNQYTFISKPCLHKIAT